MLFMPVNRAKVEVATTEVVETAAAVDAAHNSWATMSMLVLAHQMGLAQRRRRRGNKCFRCTVVVISSHERTTAAALVKHTEDMAMVFLARGVAGKSNAGGKNQSSELWISDNGTTYHVTPSAPQMYDFVNGKDKATIATGTEFDVQGYGRVHVSF